MRRVRRMITARPIAETLRKSNANLVRFINTELDLAETLLSMASDARWDMRTRSRSKRNARLAYDSAIHFLDRAELSPAEGAEIVAQLEWIKATLKEIDSQAM